MQRGYICFLSSVLLFTVFYTAWTDTDSVTDKNSVLKSSDFTFYVNGTLNYGLVTYYPYEPVPDSQDYSIYTTAFGPNPAKPYDLSYSFGMSIDYRVMDFLSLFFDGGYSSWYLLLGKKDGYGHGEWVGEATNYTTAVVGPLVMDTYYYMDTTFMRLGGRYIFSTEQFQPWFGLAVGLYAWNATIGNKELALKSGNPDSGLAFGYSALIGIDFVMDDIILRFYGDLGSAVANPEISGLLTNYPDAVFSSTGGEHVTAPYGAGLSIGLRF